MMEMEPITEPLESLKRTLTGHARDWAKDEGDSWIYGVVVGWGDALADVATIHGWKPKQVERLKMLRAKFERLEAREGLPEERFVCAPKQRETSAFLLAAEKAGWTKDQVIEAQRGDVERLYRALTEKALKAPPEPIRIDLPEKVFSFARQVLASELEHAAKEYAQPYPAGLQLGAELLRKAPETPPWTAEIGVAICRRMIGDTAVSAVIRTADGRSWRAVWSELERATMPSFPEHHFASPQSALGFFFPLLGTIPRELLPYLPSLIEKDATR